MSKNRILAQQILAEKNRRQGVQKAIRRVLDGPKDMRYKRLSVLRQLASEGYIEAKAALQQVYAEDSRHWSEWDTDPLPEIDAYTGADDDAGYIVIGPDQYLEFVREDGIERIGYQQLRWLLDILEDREDVQSKELVQSRYVNGELVESKQVTEASAIIRSAMGPYPDEPEEFPLEDRGYQPPTFTPSLELNWGDIEAWENQHRADLDICADEIFKSLHTASLLRQKIGDRLKHASATQREILLQTLRSTPMPKAQSDRLEKLLIGSELTWAERYHVIRRVAMSLRKRIPEDVLLRIEREGQKAPGFFEYLFALQASQRCEELIESSHIAWFAELFEEELDASDAPGPVDETPSWIIEREADQALEDILGAPVIKIARSRLKAVWNISQGRFPENSRLSAATRKEMVRRYKEMVPDPNKVISQTRGKYTYFWLKNPADWQTLQRLYKLTGLDLPGSAIHSHTPHFQRTVLEAVIDGVPTNQAYKIAWESYREALAERKRQPKAGSAQMVIAGFDADKQRFVGLLNGRKVMIHPDALDKAPIAMTEQSVKVLSAFANYPAARKLLAQGA